MHQTLDPLDRGESSARFLGLGHGNAFEARIVAIQSPPGRAEFDEDSVRRRMENLLPIAPSFRSAWLGGSPGWFVAAHAPVCHLFFLSPEMTHQAAGVRL
jgi:hypothetical protein